MEATHEKLLTLLKKRTLDILYARLLDGKTLLEISEVYGITSERVRQIETAGLVKLQKFFGEIPLKFRN